MTAVVDASLVVAALVDRGDHGAWARSVIASEDLPAPHLMPIEVTSVLRRGVHAGHISADVATLAHRDLLDLRIAYFPYAPFADRAWELHGALTPYNACYVALAETLDAGLATLDLRLAKAPGPLCPFVTP